MSLILKKAKQFVSIVTLTSLALADASSAFAQTSEEAEAAFGTIDAPPGVEQYNLAAGAGGIGLIIFLSMVIRIVTIVAGLYVFLNLITAGYDYISAGDSKAHQAVKDKISMSIIGLVIIVLSYVIIALISYILFGDPSYILSPTIMGPARG